jgi:hypothetical protein
MLSKIGQAQNNKVTWYCSCSESRPKNNMTWLWKGDCFGDKPVGREKGEEENDGGWICMQIAGWDPLRTVKEGERELTIVMQMGWICLKDVVCVYVNITMKPFVQYIFANKEVFRKESVPASHSEIQQCGYLWFSAKTFFFPVGLGLELKTSLLQSRCSTTGVHLQSMFTSSCVSI